MDGHRFDQWTRSLRSLVSRRVASTILLGGMLGGVLSHVGPEAAAAKCVKPGRTCKTKRAKRKKCCGGAKCRGKKCKCPAGREACGKRCCAQGATCQGGTCVPCDVCARGCAFASVQTAVDVATPGSTLRLCPGTYAEHITIAKNLSLVGAGANRTVLDGLGILQVLTVQAGTTAVSIRQLTVTRGSADIGGGIINHGRLNLIGITVANNSAQLAGGGIRNRTSANLTLDNVSVASNHGGNGGGGIYNEGSAILSSSSVTGNTAGINGGGIFNFGGLVTIGSSSVTGNTAGTQGGGIYNADFGAVTIELGATVQNNTPNNCAGDPVVGDCPAP